MNQTTFLQSVYPQLVVTKGHTYIYNIEEREVMHSDGEALEVEVVAAIPLKHDLRGMQRTVCLKDGNIIETHHTNLQKPYSELEELYNQLLENPFAQAFKGQIKKKSGPLSSSADWGKEVFLIEFYFTNGKHGIPLYKVLTFKGEIKALSGSWIENVSESKTLKYIYEEEVCSACV